jgi:hypothetical protein
MAEVCVSQHFGIDGGVLSIESWTIPRIVHDQTYNSTGDGTYGQQTTLPGKLMIDSSVITWTNSSPLNAMVLLRLQRAYRNWLVSSPNYVQIRDRYTYTIGGATPRTPDTSSTYHGHSGGGIDVGVNYNGATIAGTYREWEDPTMAEDWLGPVPPGEDLKVWYRCYLWTPPPWSNNANAGSPTYDASVRSTRIQLIAFPTQDTEIVS